MPRITLILKMQKNKNVNIGTYCVLFSCGRIVQVYVT